MKTILCPTDFSKCSLYALLYAYEIALQSGAKLYLLHTYHMPVIIPLMEKHLHPEPAASKQYEREISEKMENLVAWLNKIYAPARVSTTYRIVPNFTVDEVVKVTYEEQIDLIVMSTTETGELKDIFLKMPVVRVIEETQCPVLTIPARASYTQIRRMLYITQADVVPAEELAFIKNFSALFNASVTMLHTSGAVHTSSSSRQARSVAPAAVYESSAEYALTDVNIPETIYTINQQTPADLLIISAHRKNLLEQLHATRSSLQSGYQLDVPVLILR